MTAPLPCPLCGCTDLSENEWYLDDGDSAFSEVPAYECRNCKAGAPRNAWNKRPDPWRYLPDLPEIGQTIVFFYENDDGQESGPTVIEFIEAQWLMPIVRWMAVPEATR